MRVRQRAHKILINQCNSLNNPFLSPFVKKGDASTGFGQRESALKGNAMSKIQNKLILSVSLTQADTPIAGHPSATDMGTAFPSTPINLAIPIPAPLYRPMPKAELFDELTNVTNLNPRIKGLFCRVLDVPVTEKLPEKLQELYGKNYTVGSYNITSCASLIYRVIKDQLNKEDDELFPEVQKHVLELARLRLDANMKNQHDLKNIFRVADVDARRVRRVLINGKEKPRVVIPSRNGSEEVPQGQMDLAADIIKALHEIVNEPNYLEDIFEKTMPARFVRIGLDNQTIEQEKKRLLTAIRNDMCFEIVKGHATLLPVDDMATVTHFRRHIRQKKHYDGKKYAIWFGELLLGRLLQGEYKISKHKIARLILEQAQHADRGDTVGHSELLSKEWFGQYIEHDWVFESHMYSRAVEAEMAHDMVQSGRIHFDLPVQRVLANKVQELFCEVVDIEDIDTQTNAEFYCVCYKPLREMILAKSPLARIALTRETMRQLEEEIKSVKVKNDKAFTHEALTEIVSVLADKGLSTNMQDRHELKDVDRIYDIRRGVVRRILSCKEAKKRNVPMVKPRWKEPSESFDASQDPYYTDILTVLTRVRTPQFLSQVFEEFVRPGYSEITDLNTTSLDQYRDEHITDILNNMSIDLVDDKATVRSTITAHARRGVKRKWKLEGLQHGYDNAEYAFWGGKLFFWLLCQGPLADKDAAKLIWEESKHFGYGDTVIHYHPNGQEGIKMTTKEQFKDYVYHDMPFNRKLSIVGGLAGLFLAKMQNLSSQDPQYREEASQALMTMMVKLKTALDNHETIIDELININDNLIRDIKNKNFAYQRVLADRAFQTSKKMIAKIVWPVHQEIAQSIDNKILLQDLDDFTQRAHNTIRLHFHSINVTYPRSTIQEIQTLAATDMGQATPYSSLVELGSGTNHVLYERAPAPGSPVTPGMTQRIRQKS